MQHRAEKKNKEIRERLPQQRTKVKKMTAFVKWKMTGRLSRITLQKEKDWRLKCSRYDRIFDTRTKKRERERERGT
jgi:hypothetical protein